MQRKIKHSHGHNFAHYAVDVVGDIKSLSALLTLVLLLSIVEGDPTWQEKPTPFFSYVAYGLLMLWGKYVYASSVPLVENRAQWAERWSEDAAFFDTVYTTLPCMSPRAWALFEHVAIVLWYMAFSGLGFWCSLLHPDKPDPSSWTSAPERLLSFALRLQGCGCALGCVYYAAAFFACPKQTKQSSDYS